ncbi:hypothetical protein [uncultured Sharpea sp.]|uniref:hypothetical protein n=1 Tax=uncultured Sharpea sp. TaxID=1112738 RepID=UPI002589C73C|nr:hypothetical protein [uncultured Sharpea sp.]
MNMQEIYKGLENDPTHHSYYSILSAIPYDPEKIAAMDEKDYRHLLASLHDLASHSIGQRGAMIKNCFLLCVRV